MKLFCKARLSVSVCMDGESHKFTFIVMQVRLLAEHPCLMYLNCTEHAESVLFQKIKVLSKTKRLKIKYC